MKKLVWFLILCFTWVFVENTTAWGGEPEWGTDPGESIEELDFSDIGEFLKNTEEVENISFGELVKALLSGEELPYEKVGDWLKDILLKGFQENRTLFLEIIVLSLAFSVLKNFAKSFSGTYISEVCFLIVYCFFMALLLRSFFELNQTVVRTV